MAKKDITTLLRKSVAERLKKHSKEAPSGCIEWQRALNAKGYGLIKCFGKCELAHRISYSVNFSEIPASAQVLHACDNPKCINPKHLFLGDNAANVADRVRKNRSGWSFGEAHPQAKLNDSKVLEILASKKSLRILAKRFGVSRSLIGQIKQRTSWAHISFRQVG